MDSAATCPFHHGTHDSVLRETDELLLPMHKRCIVQYTQNDEGVRELHIYYGDKEISFDEPDLFAFGETLAKQPRFIAGSALSWGNGYTWERLRPLFDVLIEQGILQRAAPELSADTSRRGGTVPSPLPPAPSQVAHHWNECETLTERLTGRTLELGYLELVIPIFRVAHIALDADGRQVGEANVFPASLRVEVETEWRTCPYAGSRYLDERPMNATALRTMSEHWPQMMGTLRRIRECYLQRFPATRLGWTLGSIEALATLVLAVPTFQLMRQETPVVNGALHPALASVFRVTDGLRMVTHQMIFVPIAEPMLPVNTPMSVHDVYEYAERNHAFSSAHGVCAGPRTMVNEFLRVLIDGDGSDGLDTLVLAPAVEQALADIDKAFDYGLLGLQAHSVMFSFWPAMTRCFSVLHVIASRWDESRPAVMLQWQARLREQFVVLTTKTHHAKELWRTNREKAYADIYAHCAAGLGEKSHETLEQALTPILDYRHVAARTVLMAALMSFCGNDAAEAKLLLDAIWPLLLRGQSIVRVASALQREINQVLGRTQPTQKFALSQLDIHNLLQGEDNRRLPFLFDELRALLHIDIEVFADDITINRKNR